MYLKKIFVIFLLVYYPVVLCSYCIHITNNIKSGKNINKFKNVDIYSFVRPLLRSLNSMSFSKKQNLEECDTNVSGMYSVRNSKFLILMCLPFIVFMIGIAVLSVYKLNKSISSAKDEAPSKYIYSWDIIGNNGDNKSDSNLSKNILNEDGGYKSNSDSSIELTELELIWGILKMDY